MNLEIIRDADDDPEGNVRHIAEHGLTVDEVESALNDPRSATGRSRSSGRPITFGCTLAGRSIAVVWEEVNDYPRMITVVTASEPDDGS